MRTNIFIINISEKPSEPIITDSFNVLLNKNEVNFTEAHNWYFTSGTITHNYFNFNGYLFNKDDDETLEDFNIFEDCKISFGDSGRG